MTSQSIVNSKNLVARRLRQDISSQKESRLKERLRRSGKLRDKQLLALDFLSEQIRHGVTSIGSRDQHRILSSLVNQLCSIFEFQAAGLMWVNANSMLELYEVAPAEEDEHIHAELEYLRRTGAIVRVLQNNKPALKEASNHEDWLVYHAIRTDDHVLGLFVGVLPDQEMIDAVLLKLFDVILRNTAYELDRFSGENRELADNLYRIGNEDIEQVGGRMKFISDRDRLTGLANRENFIHHLDILCAEEAKKDIVVVSFDFENFNSINDSYGYQVGDAVLLEASCRLSEQLNQTETLNLLNVDRSGIHIARIGEDEFGLIAELGKNYHQEAVERAVQSMVVRLTQAYEVEDKSIQVKSNAGISCYPKRAHRSDELMMQATRARLSIRKQGAGQRSTQVAAQVAAQVAVYEPASHDPSTLNKLVGKRELLLALKEQQILVWYQPKINLESGEIIGAEALVRWQHPEKGLLLPDEFIPLAEEAGLIRELGESVLRDACKLVAEALDAGFDDFRVSINLSAVQILDDGLAESFKAILDTHQASAQSIELELTEVCVNEDVEQIAKVLTEFAAMGFHISIDDFGKGRTSLAVLRNLPVKLLKIDQTFIQGLEKDMVNKAIVNALVSMGRDMDVRILAEGVETSDQLELVRNLGCDEVQGYFVAKPSGLKSFHELMAEWKSGVVFSS